MKTTNNKKGFTIIEVVLVLAIAGLIFMMVFLALPALQRSQRDTQRSTDMARIITALNNYQSNNRGRLPSKLGPSSNSNVDLNKNAIIGHEEPDMEVKTSDDSKSWLYFYDQYLIISSAGATDSFRDPDSTPYSLVFYDCKNNEIKAGEDCTVGQRYNVSFADQQAGFTPEGENATPVPDHAVSIIERAACDGEVAKYAGGRKIAVVYKKEGAGTICLTN
jgi:prepilin-type N-terminal cleavage/methylation domain-containing protein